MFKRIFAVVLMLCMLPRGAAYAQENPEETEAAAIVTGLGLMQYYDDGDFRGDWYVSFDELADAYFRMLGQEQEDAFSKLKQEKLLPETAEPEKIAEVSDAVFLMVIALGGKSLIEKMPLTAGDTFAVGGAQLRFVPLCGPEFNWNAAPKERK